MIRWSISESPSRFWWPSEFENVANPAFKNLKHFQNPGHLLLTEPSITYQGSSVTGNIIILDSGFCVLKDIISPKKHGVYVSAFIKKRRYRSKLINGELFKLYMDEN